MTDPLHAPRSGPQLAAATFGILTTAALVWSLRISVRYMGGQELSAWPGEVLASSAVELVLALALIVFAGLAFARKRAGILGLAAAGALGLLWVLLVYPLIGHDPFGVYFERLFAIENDFEIFYFLVAVFSLVTVILSTTSLKRVRSRA